MTIADLQSFTRAAEALGTTQGAISVKLKRLEHGLGHKLIERTPRLVTFDFSVFRIRNFSGALFGSMAMNSSFWPFMIYLPIYFQAGLGYDSVTAGLSLLAYTLPTLVVPPVAERLALRYRPGLVIPMGLFTIGLGFVLMKVASAAAHASWLTMLPGCLLAGVGLGLTNTPVTNTTTGSVPGESAGMASGIDMSARMISLAVNIALMGFILVEGVHFSLRGMPSDAFDEVQLRLAEELPPARRSRPNRVLSGATIHQALADGFGWVMLYGGIAAWVLAAFSLLTFERRERLQELESDAPH